MDKGSLNFNEFYSEYISYHDIILYEAKIIFGAGFVHFAEENSVERGVILTKEIIQYFYEG